MRLQVAVSAEQITHSLNTLQWILVWLS